MIRDRIQAAIDEMVPSRTHDGDDDRRRVLVTGIADPLGRVIAERMATRSDVDTVIGVTGAGAASVPGMLRGRSAQRLRRDRRPPPRASDRHDHSRRPAMVQPVSDRDGTGEHVIATMQLAAAAAHRDLDGPPCRHGLLHPGVPGIGRARACTPSPNPFNPVEDLWPHRSWRPRASCATWPRPIPTSASPSCALPTSPAPAYVTRWQAPRQPCRPGRVGFRSLGATAPRRRRRRRASSTPPITTSPASTTSLPTVSSAGVERPGSPAPHSSNYHLRLQHAARRIARVAVSGR